MRDRFPYQDYGVDKIQHRQKTVLLSPPGSGKTRIIIDALEEDNIHDDGVILVFCSGVALATWVKEVAKWSGADTHVVQGMTAPKRKKFWEQVRSGEIKGYIIANYDLLRRDFELITGHKSGKNTHIAAVVCDEYHKAFRNPKTVTFERLKRLARHVKYLIPCSGTALGKHAATLWTGFHICNPQVFRGYWKFVHTFCIVDDDNPFGGPRILATRPSTLENLKGLMNHYFAYIPDDVVADQLPKGVRHTLTVSMDREQQDIYHNLSENMMSFAGEELIFSPNAMDVQVKLRQLLCCPKLLDSSLGMGGGYTAILEWLEEKPHSIIFVPFRDAVPIIADALRQEGYPVSELRGGMSAVEVKDAVEYFRNTRGIIISTIHYAESWDAETCDNVYFLGYIHQTDQLTQAEGRVRRAISEHRFVQWNYIEYRDTFDEKALEDIEHNFRNIGKTLKRPDEFIRALKGESDA